MQPLVLLAVGRFRAEVAERNEWHLLYCRDCLASSFSFRPINSSCRHHWGASALIFSARASESQAPDFWVSVSSVDELDLVREASLQRRECRRRGLSLRG